MRPKTAKDPPRLLASGTVADSNISLQCYLDTEPLFSAEDPVKALILLLAAYFVFGVGWPTLTRQPLVFLCAAVIGPKHVSFEISRNNKLKDILKECKIL